MSKLKDMKYNKQDFERMIFIEKLSYLEIGRKFGVSDAYVKKIAYNLGISLPRRANFPDGWIPHNKGKKKITFCAHCGKECDYFSKKFCSFECMGLANKAKTKAKYDKAIKNNENIASYSAIRTFKRYILEEQNNKCAICEIPTNWNGLELVLVLDHIDGKADNNKRTNLRCVCPNCDSQLDTFKSKNKNSDRKGRYIKNYKN